MYYSDDDDEEKHKIKILFFILEYNYQFKNYYILF